MMKAFSALLYRSVLVFSGAYPQVWGRFWILFSMMMWSGSNLGQADKISHPRVIFSGLDKITGRIISFEVNINETTSFGTLQVTPRVCFTRPPIETPLTTTFVQVDEILPTKERKRIFSGWMFAESPGLNSTEHPVYDIWLASCKNGTKIIQEPSTVRPPSLQGPSEAGRSNSGEDTPANSPLSEESDSDGND